MQSPTLFTTAGLVHEQHALTVDDLLDRAIVDGDGRILIALVDLLAASRLRVDADLLVVEFADRSSRAVRMGPAIATDDTYIQLVAVRRRVDDEAEWVARLWSVQCGSSPELRSINATTFTAFVGSA